MEDKKKYVAGFLGGILCTVVIAGALFFRLCEDTARNSALRP